MQEIRKGRKKLHAFNKKNLSFFLGMHILFLTLPDFFITLFMIIYYLSLYYASTHLFHFLEFKIINYSFKMSDFLVFISSFKSLFKICKHWLIVGSEKGEIKETCKKKRIKWNCLNLD